MKSKKFATIAAALALALTFTTFAGHAVEGVGPRQEESAEDPQAASEPVSDEIQRRLLTRDIERPERDMTTLLADQWGLRVFAVIAASERNHVDAVEELLARRGAGDAMETVRVGDFKEPQLNRLFAELLARGCRSVEEAIAVALEVAKMDVAALAAALSEKQPDDVTIVYLNLLRASQKHMIALGRRG